MQEVIKFKCSICGEIYDTKEQCESCENKPITQDKGVKIGDEVRVIKGYYQGLAKVVGIRIESKHWRDHYFNRYWHTIGLSVNCINGLDSRSLSFDDYETIK